MLILAGALPDASWLTRPLREQAAAEPHWHALASRAVQTEVRLAAPGAVAEPGHLRLLAKHGRLPTAGCWPAVDLARRFGLPLTTPVWRATPVHFLIGRDHVRLMDPRGLALTTPQARALFDSVATLFAEEALMLEWHSPLEWSVRAQHPGAELQLDTFSLAGAIGRSVEARLPAGAQARRWRRLLNEVQMTWHPHPENAAREAQGLWPVNGLWLEGPSDPGVSTNQECTQSGQPDATPQVELSLHEAVLSGDPLQWLQAWQAMCAIHLSGLVSGQRLALTGDCGWRILEVRSPTLWWQRWRSGASVTQSARRYLQEA
jgi:hypothetical protein